VHEYAPPGSYASVRAWHGRAHYLSTIVPVALRMHEDELRGLVSLDLMRRYFTVATGYVQDQRTGRRCIVRPDTIASVLGITKRAVQLCRRVARQIGLEVVIRCGRMLNLAECTAARRRGSNQRGLSTEVAYTIPLEIPRELWIFTPTRGTPRTRQPHLITHYLSAASGAKVDAASPRQPEQRRPRCPEGRGLAIQLVRRLPWLTTERPGRLAPPLQRFAVAGWDADGLLLQLHAAARRQGRTLDRLTADQIRTRPAILLAGLLRGLDPEADHPDPPDLHPVGPCTRAECVHGWIDLPDGTAAKCPDCHPRTRLSDEDQVPTTDWDPDEPPF